MHGPPRWYRTSADVPSRAAVSVPLPRLSARGFLMLSGGSSLRAGYDTEERG